MNREIKLKRATLEDIDDILEIEKSLDGKTYSALKDSKELIDEIASRVFYLIKENDEIVGEVSYKIKDDGHVYLNNLAVAPQFQGRGVGRRVMGMILEELKDKKSIDLVTHPANSKAIRLYESLGFKQSGEQMENYYGDGEPRIRMVLEK